MFSVSLLLFLMAGFVLQIGLILEQYGNERYSTVDYFKYGGVFKVFFWVLFCFAMYGYIQHPLPNVLKIKLLTIKSIYHIFIVVGHIYVGMSICYYLFKSIFRK